MSTITNARNQKNLQIQYADTFFKRFLGLMGKPEIGEDEGLLFILEKPSRLDAAIHMFFMRFDISVIWLSEDLKVVDTAHAKKWHPSYMPREKVKYYIETHPSQLSNFAINDQVELQP